MFVTQLIKNQPIKNIDLGDKYSIRPWLIEEDGCYKFKTNYFAMDIKSINGQESNPEEKIICIFPRTNFLFLNIYHFKNSTTKFIEVSVNDRTVSYQITYKLENGIWTTEKWYIGYNFIYNNFLSKNNTTKYSPTDDYHPTTKKYMDESFTKGLDSIVLKSPNGTLYNLSVDDTGNLTATAVIAEN